MTFVQKTAALVFGLSMALCGGAFAADSHYDVMEFTGPAAGQELPFEAWYSKTHIPAVLKVPGVKSVQRFRVEQAQRPGTPFSPFYLQIGLDTSDLQGTAQKLKKLLDEGSALEDPASTVTAYYLPQPKLMAKDVPGTAPAPAVAGKTELKTFYLLAMVNADPAHDAEFNQNYDEKHFPDVIRNPGVTYGQRSKQVHLEPAGAEWPGYLAAYEYRAYDIPAANDEVNRRLKEHITRPLIFTGKGGHTWYSDAMGPVLTAH